MLINFVFAIGGSIITLAVWSIRGAITSVNERRKIEKETKWTKLEMSLNDLMHEQKELRDQVRYIQSLIEVRKERKEGGDNA